jgi:hypothetical protein
MACYRRLPLMQREELSRMSATGYSLQATAHALERTGQEKGTGYSSNNFGGRLRGLSVDSSPKAAAILACYWLLTDALTARHFLSPALSPSVHLTPPCRQRG